LQAGRLWVIASLGPYWTTRIITLPDAPLVRRGPYRYAGDPAAQRWPTNAMELKKAQ
jgi:methyltransferase